VQRYDHGHLHGAGAGRRRVDGVHDHREPAAAAGQLHEHRDRLQRDDRGDAGRQHRLGRIRGRRGAGDSDALARDPRIARRASRHCWDNRDEAMTRIRVSILDSDALRQGDASLIEEWRSDSGARLWVDIEDPDSDILEELLEGRFGFHELAAEDSLSPNTLPKYDAFPTYDFFVFRAVNVNLREHGSQTYKLSAFLGRDFLFTVHNGRMEAIDQICARLPEDKRILSNGPDYLLYEIVDLMVDAYFPLLEKVEECVDDLQDAIFLNAKPGHLDELLH